MIEAIFRALPLLMAFALAGLTGFVLGYQKAMRDITIVVRKYNEEQEAQAHE